ncbi:hypothetical protein GGR88_001314 [Sphingomonas jejuensis]|uniref:Uncharacterized protein n=1 Tax=Sphingomonas jejuensis TaxID=904715 RepID=A0ABX0XKS9_9SPHN|nr:hypothetical protein [Sphingomonas jejuensis]NJC33840.1 hypothetical protein [Sphingomonas jejuensis]
MTDVENGAERLQLAFRRLAVWPEDEARILRDIFSGFARRRKKPGSSARAFPAQAETCWAWLITTDIRMSDSGVAWQAFRSFRRLTIETVAEELVCTRGTAAANVHALVDHGFAERRMAGLVGEVRLMIPVAAIVEFVADLTSDGRSLRYAIATERLRSALTDEFHRDLPSR